LIIKNKKKINFKKEKKRKKRKIFLVSPLFPDKMTIDQLIMGHRKNFTQMSHQFKTEIVHGKKKLLKYFSYIID
jgi:uncharacterized membrane protein (GlpM family)